MGIIQEVKQVDIAHQVESDYRTQIREGPSLFELYLHEFDKQVSNESAPYLDFDCVLIVAQKVLLADISLYLHAGACAGKLSYRLLLHGYWYTYLKRNKHRNQVCIGIEVAVIPIVISMPCY